MRNQYLDDQIRSVLAHKEAIVPEDLWGQLEAELDANKTNSYSKLYWISGIAAMLLISFNLFNWSRNEVTPISFASSSASAFVEFTPSALQERKAQIYVVERQEVWVEKEVVQKMDPIVGLAEATEPELEDTVISNRAVSLLAAVEKELSLEDDAVVASSPVLMRIDPELLLQDVERESSGNKFTKKLFDKIKGGLKEIGTTVASRNEK